MVGHEFSSDADFALALDEIAEMGARNVLITRENGVHALVREGPKTRRFQVDVDPVEPVSTVGSGDALLAGLPGRPDAQAADRGMPPPGRRLRHREHRSVGAGRFDPRDATRFAALSRVTELTGSAVEQRRAPRLRWPSATVARILRKQTTFAAQPSVPPSPADAVETQDGDAGVEIEIGRGKKARRAYGFDDIAIVPSRRTRDAEDVDIGWKLGPHLVELPLLASAMDGVVSPATAIALGRMGGIGVLNLEGIWGRYEDADTQLEEIAELEKAEATRRMQEIY